MKSLKSTETVTKEVDEIREKVVAFPSDLGRLAVVRNTSGKSRVVGMTNYWIQITLYPIHKAIFSFIGTLSTDGTFDQHKPLIALINSQKDSGRRFYSFDLSAATDRLPVALQEQVLACFSNSRLASL